MVKAMHNVSSEGLTGAIFGYIGGSGAAYFLGITWKTAWENLGGLLWVGFVALFTGAMGAIGAHLVKKYLLKRKK